MSAEVVRAAARLMRKEQTVEHALGHIDDRERDTWLATADWLDYAASYITDKSRLRTTAMRHALTVARTYLGDLS